MNDDDAPKPMTDRTGRRWLKNAPHVPIWKKSVLVFAMFVAAVGALITLTSPAAPPPQELRDVRSTDADLPANARGFNVGGKELNSETLQADARTFWQRMGPHIMKAGLGFAGGFVLGYFFRSYLKTAAMLAALVSIGVPLAIFFNLIDIDLGDVQSKADTGIEWISTHVKGLAMSVFSQLPSVTFGGLGAAMGFMKK